MKGAGTIKRGGVACGAGVDGVLLYASAFGMSMNGAETKMVYAPHEIVHSLDFLSLGTTRMPTVVLTLWLF